MSVCQDGVLHLFVLESHNHVKTSDPHLPVTTVQFAAQDTQSLKVQSVDYKHGYYYVLLDTYAFTIDS